MTEDSFRVVFVGRVKQGMQPTDVKRRLARIFRLDESKLDPLFRGKPVIVKKGMDRAIAEKYAVVLDQAGAICRIESEPPIDVSAGDLKRVPEEQFRGEARARAEVTIRERIAEDQGGKGGNLGAGKDVPPGSVGASTNDPTKVKQGQIHRPISSNSGKPSPVTNSTIGATSCPQCGRQLLPSDPRCLGCGRLNAKDPWTGTAPEVGSSGVGKFLWAQKSAVILLALAVLTILGYMGRLGKIWDGINGLVPSQHATRRGASVGGTCRYINRAGQTVLGPYEGCSPFSGGRAPVMTENHWGLIDPTGHFVVPPRYSSIGYPREGLVATKLDGRWGVIDEQQKVILPFQYDSISLNPHGLIEVCSGGKEYCNGGKHGLLDSKGRTILPLEYEEFRFGVRTGDTVNGSLGNLNAGLVAVKKNDTWGFADVTTGRLVIPLQFAGSVNDFKEGLLRVHVFALHDPHNGCYYLDKTGRVQLAIPGVFDLCTDFSDGLAYIHSRVDPRGNPAPPSSGYFVDATGSKVLELPPGVVLVWPSFTEGLVAVGGTNGKVGFMDKAGTIVIAPAWDFADVFLGGLARVGNGKKYGAIDKTGKIVIPVEYDDLNVGFLNGPGSFTKDGKSGLISKQGEVLIYGQKQDVVNWAGGEEPFVVRDK